MTRKHTVARITTGTTGTPVTTNLAAETCFLAQLVVFVKNAGTAWTLEIKDKAGTPRTWAFLNPVAVPADGLPVIKDFAQGQDPQHRHGHLMEGGIDAITAGTTAGELAIKAEFGVKD